MVIGKVEEETADLTYASNASITSNLIEDNLDRYNVIDVLKNASRQYRSTGNVEFVWNSDGSCTITGTNTSTVICNMYSSATVIPAWLETGRDYYVKFSSSDSKVTFRIYNGGAETQLYNISGDTVINIPATTTGLVIRFTVASGTHNVTVNPKILSGIPAKELTDRIKAVPPAPETNGTYTLRCVVSSGTPTYSWVSV